MAKKQERILVIDDERSIRNTVKEVLEYEKYHVSLAENGLMGIDMVKKEHFDLILCDIKMPEMDGIEALEKLQGITDTPIVMISGHGNTDIAVESIKKGAYDYISKPIDLNRLLVCVRNGLDNKSLVTETKKLRTKIQSRYTMVGEHQAMLDLYDMIDKVAATDARVLITGDNGTGKELAARAIFERSQRSKQAFIEVNCAAIPSELIESQLFGHEKGSFTSAIKQRKGDFELANGGTLFLDEIGDMNLSAQAKVLRALQENKITRVGGEKEIKVNVRIIAATNKDLKKEIAEGRFREDLYHRLSVIMLHVPALKDRPSDIPLLVEHFLDLYSSEQAKEKPTITEEAMALLQAMDWTGNVRELRNVIERLVILADNEISVDHINKYVV